MTSGLRDQVAEEVRALMARKRITQVQLAQQMGRHQSYVSRRCLGREPFDVDDLEQVARILGVPVSVIFGDARIGSTTDVVTPRYPLEPTPDLVRAAA